MKENGHTTVLLKEAVEGLAIKPGATIVDATGGGGGHSARIIEAIGKEGTLIVIDSDPVVVTSLQERFRDAVAQVKVLRGNFRDLRKILEAEGVEQVDGVLADLGWNSEQFKHSGKGFSFAEDEPLVMTYGPKEEYSFVARDILNDWSEGVIADVLYAYADERYARRIAKRIVEVRERTPIETTGQLVSVVRESVPGAYARGRIHPATKTFQALRIAVNDELDALKELIDAGTHIVRPGGRIAIISFHSIEDRIVKQLFKQSADAGLGTILTKKPIAPSREEVKENPRARSAKLRIFELL